MRYTALPRIPTAIRLARNALAAFEGSFEQSIAIKQWHQLACASGEVMTPARQAALSGETDLDICTVGRGFGGGQRRPRNWVRFAESRPRPNRCIALSMIDPGLMGPRSCPCWHKTC